MAKVLVQTAGRGGRQDHEYGPQDCLGTALAPFREEWVLFTSHRGGRPWIGEMHSPREAEPPAYDPTCALCPGNKRIRGENPPYTGAYCFTNDLPCFGEALGPRGDDLYRTRPALGTAEVVCYHPDHSKTFVDLTDDEARAVVDLWADRYRTLAARPEVDHVLIFENKGSLVGTSNPHPHCQIYAGNLIYAHTAVRWRAAAGSSSRRAISLASRSSGASRTGRA